MDQTSVDNTDHLEQDSACENEGISLIGNGMDVESITKVLTQVDLELAHACEKLVNLHILLMHLLAQETDLQAMILEDNDILATSIEKALVFDLISGFLDSEVKEVDSFINSLQLEIVDARHKISSCRHFGELFAILEEKLLDSEESWKHSQQLLFEMKVQLAKLQRTISTFRPEECQNGETMQPLENGYSSNAELKLKMRTTRLQKHSLRMLEKSLTRGLDLEKKLSAFKQKEEQLNVKLHHTEQVALRMEEAAEVVWGRFLEAENVAEVLMGISKEMVGRIHVTQFNLNSSIQREAEANFKIQDYAEQLKAKDIIIHQLRTSNAELEEKNSELLDLREKVKLLERQLKESELRLIDANDSFQESQEHLSHLENVIESLKESVYEAENRAESAEAKVSQLTNTNADLTEEINFLKGNESTNAEKVTLLEKQVRDLDIQVQHSKASSEASQEQQNMLYSAIWDMETLIEDLKSKVVKADNRTETVEEQCIELSENNEELNKELSFVRGRVEFLETSLDRANDAKLSNAEEINLRTKVMMDMVAKLATERECIQKQLYSLTKRNEMLEAKLQTTVKDESITMTDIKVSDEKELLFNQKNSSNSNCTMASEQAAALAEGVKERESVFNNREPSDAESSGTTGEEPELQATGSNDAGRFDVIRSVSMAFLVALLAGLAIYMFQEEISPPL